MLPTKEWEVLHSHAYRRGVLAVWQAANMSGQCPEDVREAAAQILAARSRTGSRPPIHPITAIRFSQAIGGVPSGDAFELHYVYRKEHHDIRVIISEFTLHAFREGECVHAWPVSAWLEMSEAEVGKACEGLP
jgi:hypothetical protein